jgi:glycosyltransferase involved in cell wall biosynthesis
MRILISTGIYPPEIGGPAEYAKHLAEAWEDQFHKVEVRVFSRFNFLPTGIRHAAYFLYILPAVKRAERILILDTFSAALPTIVAAKLLRKRTVVRTGGDFFWEAYVERTGDMVLLREFYNTRMGNLSIKERIVFALITFVFRNASAIAWSTEWQKEIFLKPYGLERQRHFIVENYYGPKLPSRVPTEKNFIAGTRKLKWKNILAVQEAFVSDALRAAGATLDTSTVPHEKFMEKLASSYAVVIASLGDVSPNTILDAIRLDKPFILTRENGLQPRIKDLGVLVDPKDPQDIEAKVKWLLDPENYEAKRGQLTRFTFTHTWEEMAKEYMDIWNSL